MTSSSIFKSHISDTNVCLNFRRHADDEFEPYAEAFRRAGKALFLLHFVPETRHDLDALPVAFLYRHAVELSLKAIIRSGNKLLAFRHEPLVPIRKTHSLDLLLADTKPAIDLLEWKWDAGSDGFRSFEDFRNIMNDLENDDQLGLDDRRGDVWRYPVKNDGTDSLPGHLHFDVAEFVVRLDALLDIMQGLALMLDDLFEGACEALTEAQYE